MTGSPEVQTLEPDTRTSRCRACGGEVEQFFDFGRQPLSDAFREPTDTSPEFFFRMATGRCSGCTMVQLMEEVPRERMFHEDYPYHSSGSAGMRAHFEAFAHTALGGVLADRADPFVVEIGCNDGVMLHVIAAAGVRHLGVEPSGGVADLAAAKGVRVRKSFFETESAREIRAQDGPADLIFAANTTCHIPYISSILDGVRTLLAPGGVFVFEDPYLGDIVAKTSFDQIYDEHFFFFSATSVRALARRNGLELVDVERLPVHGGEVRYTLARDGEREVSPAVEELIAQEERDGITSFARLEEFGRAVEQIRTDLLALLDDLRAQGKRVVGYGATAKSATVTNFCGITPEHVEFVSDSTPDKQHRLTPGVHLPVRPPIAFVADYPDYALLFAWNHASEIKANELAFRAAGGRWIEYVPNVHIS